MGEGWKEIVLLVHQQWAPAERCVYRWGSGEVLRQVLPPQGPQFRRGLRGGRTTCGAPSGVSETHPAPSEESRGTRLDPGSVLSSLSGRREHIRQLCRTLGPPGTSGRHTEPSAMGWEPGQALPSHSPHPHPALPRVLRLPPTGAGPGPGPPRTQGAATAPFVGFGWKLHPEASLPALPGLEVAPTLHREAAGFTPGEKWCSSLERGLSQNSGNQALAWLARQDPSA